jgi:hypothetical protein
MGVKIPINPELLKWARETAGYTLEDMAKIAKMDAAVLPEVLRELDFLEERQKRDFPQDFLELLQTPKDNGLSGEEALRIATEAIKRRPFFDESEKAS